MDRDWELAMHRGDAEWAQNLLENTADIAARQAIVDSKDRHGQTGLMLAAAGGHAEVARLLIENRADLNHTAKYHLSALMLAVINRHAPVVRILVEAGAEKELRATGAPGFADLTALEIAEQAGDEEIAALLRASFR
jgi:ankyrin repeat protein